jgi:hypothetical protein
MEEDNLDKNIKSHNAMMNIHHAEVRYLSSRVGELKAKLAKKYRHVHQLEKRIEFLEGAVLVSQSGVVSDSQPAPGTKEEAVASLTTEQITAFADQDAGWITEKVGTYESTMDLGNNTDSELGSFLRRPIRQSAQTWVVGQPFFYSFNPWAAFCENPYVRDKIKNYKLLRMKLNVKMVISGTKFHYGRALVSYNPYTAGDQVTVNRNFVAQDLIQASQKPHFFLNPTKNTGGELKLPFFWPNNYLRIPEADWQNMGDVTISSFANLLHANSGNDPVTITTYIWAEDVVLTTPTGSDPPLPSQSGRRGGRMSKGDKSNSISSQDEYGQGIISKPASAVAKMAGSLTKLPLIGPYMRATEIGADATSKVAQLFGYSRPNIISDIVQVKPSPTGNLVNTDAADGAIKLSLDSKAELTVDSRTVGLDGTDEMGILDYVKRESYLTQFLWTPGGSPDTLLWNTRVAAMQLDNVAGEIHMTPLAHMATCFEQWQGSLKFRFQVVKSDFHKGRILVRWDPNAFTSAVEYNTNYSRVVDIAETDDFEIVVGWGQSEAWKLCGEPAESTSNFSSTVRLLNAVDSTAPFSNGVLELSVLNDLVSPGIDAPISINVFVSACDDFKLAAPRNSGLRDYHLWPEGGDPFETGITAPRTPIREAEVLESQSSSPNVETGDTTISDKPTASGELMTIGEQGDQDDPTYTVFYGDPPCSIRELCKRYCYTRWWYPPQAGDDAARINYLTNKAASYHTGYDPNGLDTSTDLVSRVTIGPTAFHSWFTPAYAGVRGAYRKKYIFSAGNSRQSPAIVRSNFTSSGNGTFTGAAVSLLQSDTVVQKWMTASWPYDTGDGAATTNLGINNTIEVEFPYYQPKRFSKARSISAQDLDCNSHTIATTDAKIRIKGQAADYNTNYMQYDAVGEDFSLFFFTGVPIYWKYRVDQNS